ncbi:hypothetical protein MTO96_013332 [Rhipicephalus appendiculatus]
MARTPRRVICAQRERAGGMPPLSDGAYLSLRQYCADDGVPNGFPETMARAALISRPLRGNGGAALRNCATGRGPQEPPLLAEASPSVGDELVRFPPPGSGYGQVADDAAAWRNAGPR